jgi:small subunit ribosomal protein S18
MKTQNHHHGHNQERGSNLIPNSVLFNRKSGSSSAPKCPLSGKEAPEVNYKNIELLSVYVSEKGRILPRRLMGVCATKHRELKKAIKIARVLALLPF